jgi:hypothetical protein
MARIEQTGCGKSAESKLDAEPERNHFATLRELLRDRLQKLMRPNVRGGVIRVDFACNPGNAGCPGLPVEGIGFDVKETSSLIHDVCSISSAGRQLPKLDELDQASCDLNVG